MVCIYAYKSDTSLFSFPVVSSGTYIYTSLYAIPTQALSTEYAEYFGFGLVNNGSNYGKLSDDGKTISWYASPASFQLNGKDYVYYWFAIG